MTGVGMAEGYLTTHVLDTAKGEPVEGMKVELYRISPDGWKHLATKVTNKDGRTDGPLMTVDQFEIGQYELLFYAGDYLSRIGVPMESPRFLNEIPIRFGISDESRHYHVPLLLSPFGYSTYRGS